ncbi:MAG: KEOPS complex subunit Cgi121 [Candidatus Caldarchaeales archaeon]
MEITKYHDKWIGAAVYRSPMKNLLRDPARLVSELSSDQVLVNIFKANSIVSLKQIHIAAISALAAFKSKSNIARNLNIEILLRISSETQIDKALKKIGVDEETDEVGVCIIAGDKVEIDKVGRILSSRIGGIELSGEDLYEHERITRALEFYNIDREELQLIQAKDLYEAALLLIIEKIATLDVER